jgi:hypothetical protein
MSPLACLHSSRRQFLERRKTKFRPPKPKTLYHTSSPPPSPRATTGKSERVRYTT